MNIPASILCPRRTILAVAKRASVGLFVALTWCATLSAQRAVLRSLDASGYPVMRASIYAFDSTGTPVLPDTTRDRRVNDNGSRQTLGQVRYDGPATSRDFGITFVIDATSPALPKALASSITSWDTGIVEEHDAALVAFGSLPYIVRDFAQASLSLRDAASRFPVLRGGTNLTSALLDSLCGAVTVSLRDPRSRGIVLVTDAQSSVPTDSALRGLRAAGARLCVVTLGACASPSLRALALASGGVCFDSVPLAAFGSAIRSCTYIIRGAPSATIEWSNSPMSCDNVREVRFDILSLRTQLLHRYVVHDTLLRIAGIEPRFVTVPDIPVGDSVDIPVSVIARGADLLVTDVTTDDSACTPVTPVGSRILTRATPYATTLRFVRRSAKEQRVIVTIRSNACRSESAVILVKGLPGGDIRPILRTELGGRRLRPRTAQSIAWSGLAPDDSVVVELSTDAGTTWSDSSPPFGGTDAVWTVPAVSSTRCLLVIRSRLRGTTDTSDQFSINVSDLPVQPISFGNVRSHDAVDRTVSGCWKNTRTAAVQVDSVRTSSSELRLLRGEDCSVPSGSSWDCVLQLHARRSGEFVDTLSVYIDDDILRIPLTAFVTERRMFVPETIAFTDVSVGGIIDTVVEAAISLRGSAPSTLTCTRLERLPPDTSHYSVTAPRAPFDLTPALYAQSLIVSFGAQEQALSSSRIVVESADGAEEIRLVGNAVCGAPSPLTRITLPDTVSASIGDMVRIPLRYAPLPKGYRPAPRPWTLTLRVPGSLMYPVGSTPKGEMVGLDRRIVLTGLGFERGDTLTHADFVATLGAGDGGTVFVESFRWDDLCGGAEGLRDAHLAIRNPCVAGGLRAYLSGDSLHVVSISPNPAGDEAEIRYVLRETGPTAIELVDLFGRVLLALPASVQERGEHRLALPLGGLNDGEYYMRIITPTATTAAALKVVR